MSKCFYRTKALITLAVVTLGVIILAGQSQGKSDKKFSISVPIMKVSDIKPGMKGYGLTVFRGTKPERFDVEIVDVLKKAFPKHDLILARCSHPIIDKAHIIAGMSGSPIYINDKLIGALAYGWSFTKEPIAGITPIEWMLEEIHAPEGSLGGAGPRFVPPDGKSNKKNSQPHSGITRLKIPVSLSGTLGLRSKAIEKLREIFDERGLMLLEGTSGSAASENIGVDSLVPGAAIGVALLRGDITMTGIGTLTHREGNRIIAFGHPMLFSGQEIAMPLTTAFIHGVLPSQWSSFKFGSPSQSVGTLTQDGFSSIAGTLGQDCPMIPVTATIHNPSNDSSETIHVEMIDNRELSPYLVLLTSAYLTLLEGAQWSNFSVEYTLNMTFEKYGKLELKGIDTAYSGFIMFEPYRAVSRVLNNPFEPLKLKEVVIDMKAIHRRIDARIQRAWLDQLEVRPGTNVTLHLMIHPYGEKPREITFPIAIPTHLDEGKYEIVVGGGGHWEVQPPTPPSEAVTDIFTQLKTRYRPTTAVAVLKLPSVGVGFKGTLFRQLPSSAFGILVSSSSAGVSTFQDSIHFTKETQWILTGDSQQLKIIVKQSAEEEK